MIDFRLYQEKLITRLYQKKLITQTKKWLRRRSRPLKEEYLRAILILLRLDLEPARPILEACYSKDPRGKKPFDPVCMLRAFILMVILRYKSITKFANDLRKNFRLAVIAGFKPGKTPAVGTFYAFIDRLEDGPWYACKCNKHKTRPSSLRKGKHRRNLKQEKAARKNKKDEIESKCDSITEHLKEELLSKKEEPRPKDFLSRLEDLLMQCVVKISAEKGLLGDLDALTICGDGSALESGANPYGTPTCDCRKKGIYKCDHDRFYSDPTADWGYDSHRDRYYFGHTFYQHVISTNGHDLPLHILIGPASETDYTLSLKSQDRLRKALKENEIYAQIGTVIYDAGHDATGIYEYNEAYGAKSVIPLNPRRSEKPKACGNAQKIGPNGIPLCPAGLEMRRHSKGKGGRIFYNCPAKRPTHKNGRYIWKSYPEKCPHRVLCHPDTKMSPVVYVNSRENPRLYPLIPRGSPKYLKLMKLRSGCERSNSLKKETYELKDRVCRSATQALFRLYLISIVEHAKVWVNEDAKLLGIACNRTFSLENGEKILDLYEIEILRKKSLEKVA